MLRLLRPDGAIFYNHKWGIKKGLLHDQGDITNGFPVRQIIIWDKQGNPLFNPSYFLPNYEVIYLIANLDFRLAQGVNGYGCIWRFLQIYQGSRSSRYVSARITVSMY